MIMEKVSYAQVNTEVGEDSAENNVAEDYKLTWKLLVRQILISSAVWTNYFTVGLCQGSPTVIIPQIRRDANSTNVISSEMASWLSSSYSYSGMIYIIVLTILSRFLGRKQCFLLISTVALCGFIVMYVCTTITQLFISAVMQGILFGSYITISVMIITEYSSPQYRGIFLTIKSASFLWGVWISNCIGTFFHWKYIAVLGSIATVYILMTVLIWPESPLWLASKGRFEECAASHRWLKGNSIPSENELEDLVNYYKNFERIASEVTNKKILNKNIFKMICKNGFYKPLLLAMLVNFLNNSLGKMACTVYAIDIMKKMTNSESSAYNGMLILDGVSIIGAYIGSVVSKYVRRRSFIFLTSAIGIVFLFLLSLFLYLVNFNVVTQNMYISLFLLSTYSLAVSSGPMIMSSSLISEFIPVTHRNEFALIIGIFSSLCFGTFVKIAPYLFSSFGLSGLFLFYATLSSIFAFSLYKLLPETKDKTLIEVENLLTGNK